jgi:Transcription-repair coupling factor (superfamily II helicase)
VAVLVPTTLLVQQHYNTFSERMGQFPVADPQLSRFQTAKEAEQTLTMASEGTADIVIGTHRLLQNSTRFKQLGMVVVDEEQRFGVEHKEFLKQLRTSVDVLTMSATPIPRTLEMAITGIREMSTIATPPEERHPVLTFVGALRRPAGDRRDPPRAAARGPGLLPAQPGGVHREGGAPAARPGTRRASPWRTGRWARTPWRR